MPTPNDTYCKGIDKLVRQMEKDPDSLNLNDLKKIEQCYGMDNLNAIADADARDERSHPNTRLFNFGQKAEPFGNRFGVQPEQASRDRNNAPQNARKEGSSFEDPMQVSLASFQDKTPFKSEFNSLPIAGLKTHVNEL